MALIKAPMVFLLALLIASAAAATDQLAAGGSGHRREGRSTPLAGLTQCVTACGATVTSCFLDCYKPLVKGDPAMLPLCLFNCTNTAMLCASGCSTDII